ncbi:uncharacterized protein BDZ99DRAFT_574519 [Mytilinidion resinicola]|uniref:Uncharacterized protein n=1 Tax=Mytilinidion resinicola TaxID=574789 RepID=A0A6A6YCR2_9PEZI|nr:uncharacterized protein BDZ99DRAFT_574519 [Mytilinidion resinicola]KAF2805627.1 hypothetical protein BDZ99DRAFT_574519 [Mytilinidion resinicola]
MLPICDVNTAETEFNGLQETIVAGAGGVQNPNNISTSRNFFRTLLCDDCERQEMALYQERITRGINNPRPFNLGTVAAPREWPTDASPVQDLCTCYNSMFQAVPAANVGFCAEHRRTQWTLLRGRRDVGRDYLEGITRTPEGGIGRANRRVKNRRLAARGLPRNGMFADRLACPCGRDAQFPNAINPGQERTTACVSCGGVRHEPTVVRQAGPAIPGTRHSGRVANLAAKAANVVQPERSRWLRRQR